MKWVALFLILISQACLAQVDLKDFGDIDWRVRSIEASDPDSLARQLTKPYTSEIEKMRAIFSWIAQHISYNTDIFTGYRRHFLPIYIPEPLDTTSVWGSAEEMTARKVLRKRVAVCDGYAKLFKTLCDHAGLRAIVITGYAKCVNERADKFRTNHSWNAVMIDDKWYLLDVTWASGYVNYADEYVPHLDEHYFMTPPSEFINDHFPEDLGWTLLHDPPALREFQQTPFRYKSFVKYTINGYIPSQGLITAAVGDTVHIELKLKDLAKDRTIASDPFLDSNYFAHSPASAFLSPVLQKDKVVYTYVVDNSQVEWLHILYNEDIVLRYRLNIKKSKED